MTLLERHHNPWRRPPAPHRADLRELLEEAVARAFAVPAKELRRRSRRGAQVAFARQSAMYLAHVVLGLSYDEVGLLFCRHRTTVAYACRRVEDCRDEPTTDIRFDVLERLCAAIRTGAYNPQVTQ